MNLESDFITGLLNWIRDPRILTVFAIIFMTLVLSYFLGRLFQRLALKLEKTSNVWDDSLLRSLRRPVIFLTWILGIGWAIDMLATGADPAFSNLVASARYVAIVTVLAYFLIRFAREVEAGFVRKGADLTTAQAIGRLARVSVIITAVLSVLQTLGVSISGALAFGGIGGIAVGFAAKDLLSNFFGGLMLYLDRPFVVGDWVRSPDREIEGTVEHIGWRLTVIRTFDQRPLYVPNSVFANISVENPSRMLNRRIYEKIGLRYADASVVKAIIDETRAFLGNHPDIDNGRTLIVNLNTFAPSSLEFFIYTFTRTVNWVEFHQIKEKILLEVLAIIERHGAEVAFPTSTLHIQHEPGIDTFPPSDGKE